MDKKVGILGGGQLSQMLVQAAHNLGLKPVVYTEVPKEGAGKIADHVVVGTLSDPQALSEFLSQVDLVVFENEFVRCDLLKEHAVRTGGPKFVPDLDCLTDLRDKVRQKKTLDSLGIPSAPWTEYPGTGDAADWLRTVQQKFREGYVLKWGGMGYDGKGVLPVLPSDDLAPARAFCEAAFQKKVSLYAEERVEFEREWAIVSSRSVTGEFRFYPVVRSVQTEGICDWVAGPGEILGLTAKQVASAQAFAERLATAKALFGTFALELFELKNGEVIVNEIAPRVHNSGHFSLDGSGCSQFENHWRAVLGMPLGDTQSQRGFVMVNLLGPEGASGALDKREFPSLPKGARLYWYDKKETRPKRKVGHINALASDLSKEGIEKTLATLQKYRTEWITYVKKPKRGLSK